MDYKIYRDVMEANEVKKINKKDYNELDLEKGE